MRFGTGIHPRHWHLGAWLLAVLLLVLAILLSHRSTGAQSDAAARPPGSEAASGYVAEIVDSTYTVGPAEFFALDLPTVQPGFNAVHLFGTVTTKGKGKDIMIRLFEAPAYDRWLKQKSGVKPEPLWTSKRSKSLTLDQALPPGKPIVLLLDNGYSIRTPKKVQCQIQLRYAPSTIEVFDTETVPKTAGSEVAADTTFSNLPAPRSNLEEDFPPPPPPPPAGY